MFEVIGMMAVPAAFLLTVRWLNLRDERRALRNAPVSETPGGETAS